MKLVLLSILAVAGSCAPLAGTLNIKSDFHAAGDGVTDDYGAIVEAARVTCATHQNLYFPPGNYKIDRYKISGGPKANGVLDIVWKECNGVHIVGYGAKITVKGDFKRSADYRIGNHSFSYSSTVIPFYIEASTDWTLEGIELYGQADLSTRDPEVVEGLGYGLRTTDCANYTIRDVRVHHFQTDGLCLGKAARNQADRYVTLDNIRAYCNGRNNLSIIHARDVNLTGAWLESAGRTGGRYGGHAPEAGLDIEPNRVLPELTGNITITNTHFEHNLGEQYVCGASTVDWVTIDRATVTADPDSANGVFLPFSQTTRIANSIFYIPKNLSLWLVNTGLVSQRTYRALWEGNYFRLERNAGIYANSGIGWDVEFRYNTIRVNSPVADSSVMALVGLAVI
jgi:hypothetical protein